jgi:hypothetical protein
VPLRPGERRDFGPIEAHHRREPSGWSWESPDTGDAPGAAAGPSGDAAPRRRVWSDPAPPPGDSAGSATMRIPLTEAPAAGCLLRRRYP